MKNRSFSNIFIVCLVTAVLVFIAFNGLKIQPLNINIPSASETVRYGIDIRGGVRVVLEAEDAEDGSMPKPSDIDIVVGVLENRLDNQQIMDRSIIPQRERGRVIVEIPRRSLDEEFDPEQQIEELGSMQMLEFYHVVPNTQGMGLEDFDIDFEQIEQGDLDETDDITAEPQTQSQDAEVFDTPNVQNSDEDIQEDTNEQIEGIDIGDLEVSDVPEAGFDTDVSQDRNGDVEQITKEQMQQFEPYEKVELILSGMDIANARPELDTQRGVYYVALNLNAEGQRKFAEATGRLVGEQIGIYLNDDLISAPSVNERIDSSNAMITLGVGGRRETLAEANRISNSINSGALPFTLTPIEINSISPVLGMSALDVMLSAAMFAILLVWLFMIGYYRLPGVFACIALLLHVVIQVLFISWSGITLTLPGIAGIILTIGMGVDANIIIFERVKEELRAGKTLRAAVDIGFKKAIAAVLDANVTTLISGLILYMLGTGPVRSFAITLMLGVFLSFLTAITASRIMLKSVARIKAARKPWLYGGLTTKE